jgi:hypothetical protein
VSSVVPDDDDARQGLAAGLDEIVREGARRMMAQALEAEADAVIEAPPVRSTRSAGGCCAAPVTPARGR